MNIKSVILLSAVLNAPVLSNAADLNILHTWSTHSAQKAYSYLEQGFKRDNLQLNSRTLQDYEHSSLAKIRKLAMSMEDEPVLVSLPIQELQQWDDLQLLQNLNNNANTQQWLAKLPAFVQEQVIYRDHVVAAPISVHISNWIFASKQLIDATGLTLSDSWPEFITLLQTLSDQGVTPILHDGSAMQDALLFESLFLATAGTDTYQKSFKYLNSQALRAAEPEFLQTFERLDAMKPFIKRMPKGTDQETVAQMIMFNRAAMVIQGDWFRGEFVISGQIANNHYYCFPIPGEHQAVSYRLDSVAALKSKDDRLSLGQAQYLKMQMEENMQYLFNNFNGGLPALKNIGLEKVSDCVAYASERINNANANNTLVPSLSQGGATRNAVREEVESIVHEFMTSNMTPADAAVALRKGIKRASLM